MYRNKSCIAQAVLSKIHCRTEAPCPDASFNASVVPWPGQWASVFPCRSTNKGNLPFMSVLYRKCTAAGNLHTGFQYVGWIIAGLDYCMLP